MAILQLFEAKGDLHPVGGLPLGVTHHGPASRRSMITTPGGRARRLLGDAAAS